MIQVEICCNSIDSARNACRGGASRIELCRDLELDGLTPDRDAIAYCVETLQLVTHVLVRPLPGGFVYDDDTFDLVRRQVRMCRDFGAAAVVVGFLNPDGTVDAEKTKEIVDLAFPMSVTFHRAFDACSAPLEALEQIVQCGCARLLTSGCETTAERGMPLIKDLVALSDGRLSVMAGAGVTPGNAARIVAETGVNEVHGSCKRKMDDGSWLTDASVVRALVDSVNPGM